MLFWLNELFSVLFKCYICLSGISLFINVINVGLIEFIMCVGYRCGCIFYFVFI